MFSCYGITPERVPLLESELVSRLLGQSMCSIWNRVGVVFALPIAHATLGRCQCGKLQNRILYKWWAGAIDKTDNGQSEGRWKQRCHGNGRSKMEWIYE